MAIADVIVGIFAFIGVCSVGIWYFNRATDRYFRDLDEQNLFGPSHDEKD